MNQRGIIIRALEGYRRATRRLSMLVEFSIIPVGSGSSVGKYLADVMKVVDGSGMPYKFNPMGTVVEGKWEEVIDIIKKCHDIVMQEGVRAITTIKIDDRRGRSGMIDSKVKSVEERLGRVLKK